MIDSLTSCDVNFTHTKLISTQKSMMWVERFKTHLKTRLNSPQCNVGRVFLKSFRDVFIIKCIRIIVHVYIEEDW